MTSTIFACELTTGRVITEIPWTTFSGKRHLNGDGDMSCTMTLADLDPARRRELLWATSPGRTTLVLDRDGQIAGEWIVWKRRRRNAIEPITLSGTELMSYASTQQMPAKYYTNVDQVTIAAELARYAFAPNGNPAAPGSVAVTIETPAATGYTLNRNYVRLEATVGQRLSELAQSDTGFEYLVEPTWVVTGGIRYVQRTFRIYYPLAGLEQPFILDQAAQVTRLDPDNINDVIQGQGGNILDLSLDEDGTRVGSTAYAIGAGEGYDKYIGVATDSGLISQGYPNMTVTASYNSVNDQSIINSLARSVLRNAQTSELPPSVTIFAVGDPGIADLNLGDRCWIAADPSINFPDGYTGRIRILGWTYSPPPAGPETIPLEIAGQD